MMKNAKARRFLSVLLSVAMIITILSSMYVYSSADELSTTEPPAVGDTPAVELEGDGSEKDPFRIGTKEELEAMRDYVNAKESDYVNAHYILTDDIELDSESSWSPIGRDSTGLASTYAFTGVFDGQGHTISGLHIDTTGSGSRKYTSGLFGYNDGTIKNLIVEGNITADLWNGMIAGRNSGTIENCAAGGKLNGAYMNGGIAGINRGGTIKNCYSTVALTDNNSSLGIYGANYASANGDVTVDPVVENTYYLNVVSNGANVPGSTQPMSAEDFASGKVAWLLQNGVEGGALVWEQDLAKDKAPVLHNEEDGDDDNYKVFKVEFKLEETVLAEDYVNNGGHTSDPNLEKVDVDGYTLGDSWYKTNDKNGEVWNFESDTVTADTSIYGAKVAVVYEISYELNGGNDDADPNPKNYTVEQLPITLKAPTRDNDTFAGWTGTDIIGAAQLEVTIPTGSTGNRAYYAHYYDGTAPHATITIGDHNWDYLDESVEFNVFYNTSQTVTITATDNEDIVVDEIWYHIADGQLSRNDLEALGDDAWTVYTDSFTIDPPSDGLVIYAKVSDDSDNVVYVNTSGIILEFTAPELTYTTTVLVEDNDSAEGFRTETITAPLTEKTYCESVVFTATDAYLDTVTVDEQPVAAAEDGTYTVSESGSHTVVATDKAGNSTTVEVTIVSHVAGEPRVTEILKAGCDTDGEELVRVYCTNCGTIMSSQRNIIEHKGHTFGDWETIKMPNCEDQGTEQHTCSTCGYTETKNLEASGHDWEDFITVDKKATCKNTGSQSRHCKKCSAKTDVETIPLAPHNTSLKKVENSIDATCTVDGSYDTVLYCSVCRQEQRRTTNIVPATGHDFGAWVLVDTAGCEDSGAYERVCSKCNTIETQNIDPTGHSWEDYFTVDKDATCTEDGSQSYHCSKCDAKQDSTTIPATGHTPANSPVKENVVPVTCEDNGSYDMVDYCTVCHEVATTEHFVEEALDHDFTDWYEISSPDCDDEGAERRDCKRGDLSETRGVAATGHAWDVDEDGNDKYTVDSEPSCIAPGSESVHCTKCTAIRDSRTIDPLDHDWSEWEVIESPDCDDEGTEIRVCNRCKTTETKNLNPNGHAWEDDYTVDSPATCTTDGSKSIHCKNCSATKNSETIPATGHSFGPWETVTAPTCQATGIQQRVCETCQYTETAALDPTGNHKIPVDENGETIYTIVDATCTADGSKSVQCEVCGITLESEVIPATGHSFGEWETVTAPTCKDSGVQQRVCEKCQTVETATLAPTGEHKAPVDEDGNTIYTIVDATCTADGSKSVQCEVCGETIESEVIPALGHNFVDGVCTRCGESDGTAPLPEIEVDGTDDVYVIGSEDGATIHCTGALAAFVSVSVDGEIVDPSNYTVSDGSTIITFSNEYLDTLEPGVHEVTLTYTYAEVSCQLLVKDHEHVWGDKPTVDIPPSCTQPGIQSIHCTICDEVLEGSEEPIPATGHSFGRWHAISAPNCEGEGAAMRECEICGFVETSNINPLGHNFEENFTVDKEATCTTDGSMSRHCTRCDAVIDSTVIPARGYHTPVIEGAKEATCTEDGYTGDNICSACGEVFSKGIVIPAKGHNFVDGVCTVCGAKKTSPSTGTELVVMASVFALMFAGLAATVFVVRKRREIQG